MFPAAIQIKGGYIMTLRLSFVALVLTIAPTLSLAVGCQHDKHAMSCATGSSYDAATGTCVVDATI